MPLMGEIAVPQKCGNYSYPETRCANNLQKFTVITQDLNYNKYFFSKGLVQNWIFGEFIS